MPPSAESASPPPIRTTGFAAFPGLLIGAGAALVSHGPDLPAALLSAGLS